MHRPRFTSPESRKRIAEDRRAQGRAEPNPRRRRAPRAPQAPSFDPGDPTDRCLTDAELEALLPDDDGMDLEPEPGDFWTEP